MVSALTRFRDVLAFGLLGVAVLYLVAGFSLLVKSGDDLGGLGFTDRAAAFGYLFMHPILIVALAAAIGLAVGLGEPSRNAKPAVVVALAVGAVAFVAGLVAWFSAFGGDDFGSSAMYGGVLGAGKVVGVFLGLAQLLALGLVLLFGAAAYQTLPKPAPKQQPQWGGPQGYGGWGQPQQPQQQGWQQPGGWGGQQQQPPQQPSHQWGGQPQGQQQHWGQQPQQSQPQQSWGQPWGQPSQQTWGAPPEQQSWGTPPQTQQQSWGQQSQQPPASPPAGSEWGQAESDQQQSWESTPMGDEAAVAAGYDPAGYESGGYDTGSTGSADEATDAGEPGQHASRTDQSWAQPEQQEQATSWGQTSATQASSWGQPAEAQASTWDQRSEDDQTHLDLPATESSADAAAADGDDERTDDAQSSDGDDGQTSWWQRPNA